MNRKGFVHLHLHSEYSVLDGTLFVKEIVENALKEGMSAVALTDHGNLFGAIEFYKTATEKGIKPIIGMETYITEGSMDVKGKESGPIYHLTLLAETNEGYQNLLRISTEAYLKGFYYKPRIDKEFLKKHSKGLIALSGCLQGEIPRKILSNYSDDDLISSVESYLEIFGKENFFLEIQDVGFGENKIVNRKLLEISSKLGVKTVATNDVHFLKPEDKLLQEIVISIQSGYKLDDPRRMRIETDQIYFKSAEEMWQLFGELEEPLINTLEIAERVNVKLELDPTKIHLPRFEIPPQYSDPHEMLVDLANKGLRRRFGEELPEEYRERLERELKVIKDLGFSQYFLIIWDLVNEAKKRDIPVGPGRGSAVGSLVLYAIGVTDVDPIKYGLIFERFLNPERVSPPDVDIDFADLRRDEMIKYIREKYGEENVAQIITFGRAKAKQAIKDVARVLGLPYSDSDKLTKAMVGSGSLEDEYENNQLFRQLVDSNSKYKEVFDLARRVEGRVRNISTHAAGVVIAPDKIYKIAPLYKSEDDETVTVQFDMKSLELLGLLKVDLLGLRTLTIVNNTVEMVREKEPEFTLQNIPLDDNKTYELLSLGDTTGVFQLESEGFRKALKRLKPDKIEDLVAILALYRPGPIKSGMLESYIRRKNKDEQVEYVDDRVREFLEETYGVIAYQEQVMLLASKLAGFSLGEADLLRKAMGKKQKEVMEKMMRSFVDGCVKNGIEEAKAVQIFNDIVPFAEYGFNKSHAAGYAQLAYITAYLKAHYPLEFIVANMNAEMNTQDFQDKVYKFLSEARKLGFKVKSPSINESDFDFKISGEGVIVFGLGAIKNVGKSAVEEILLARARFGKFSSIEKFLTSVDTRKVNRKTLESLIKAGAFDEIFENRKSLLASLDDLLSTSKAKGTLSAGPLFVTGSLFAGGGSEGVFKFQDLPYSIEDKVLYEREALGFYLSAHPLEKYPFVRLQPYTTSRIRDEIFEGEDITLIGVVSEVVKKKSRNSETYANVTLWDLEGEIDVIIFPQLLKEKGDLLKEDAVVVLWGKVIENEEGKEVRVDDITSFKGIKGIEFDLTEVNDVSFLDKIATFLEKFSKGSLQVFVRFGNRKFLSELKVSEDASLVREIEENLPREWVRIVLA